MSAFEASLADLIAQGRAGTLSQADFARRFAAVRLMMLLGSEPEGDDVEPLVLDLPSGAPAVALFAGPDYVDDEYLAAAPHPIALTGRELLEMLPAGVGLAMNPGHPDSLVLEPKEIPSFAFVALSPKTARGVHGLFVQE